ncbi:MAG: ABC transporter permease [Thermoanaerobaculia bacterium]|nr:ABC transporter permease [Thermoanaerobaculia bacterium]MBP9824483.1 ABC transporter permease [Thermoanaerobaculia bacterium]
MTASPRPPADLPTPLSGSLLYALALRFLRGRGSRLLSSTAMAALAASTLGVTAMGVAMALMTGYRGDLQKKLVGGNAAVLVYPPLELERSDRGLRLAEEIRQLPEVTRVDRVAYVQGVMATGRQEAEVTLRGAAPGAGLLQATAAELAADADGIPGVVLGVDLAHDLGAAPGDRLRLVVVAMGEGAPKFVYRTLRFAGTFSTGFSEFDREWAVAARETVAALAPEGMESLEVSVGDLDRAPAVAEAIRAQAPEGTLVTDWKELNRELFSALALQKAALFLLLGLIVLVSTFNVASSLVVLVRERRRDLGVLAALGLAPQRMRWVFLLYGGALGATGTLAGLLLAGAISWVMNRFELISFGPEIASIYFLRAVPFELTLADAGWIGLFTLGITLVSCWLPSRRALTLDPSAALRYE